MSTASGYFGCSYFCWHRCVVFYQPNLQMETALASRPEPRRSCAGCRGVCRSPAASCCRRGPFCRSHLHARPGAHSRLRVWVSIQYSSASVSKTTSQHTTPPPTLVFKERKTLWKEAARFLGSFQSGKKGSAGSCARRGLRSGQGSQRAEPWCFWLGLLFQGNVTVLFLLAGAGFGVPSACRRVFGKVIPACKNLIQCLIHVSHHLHSCGKWQDAANTNCGGCGGGFKNIPICWRGSSTRGRAGIGVRLYKDNKRFVFGQTRHRWLQRSERRCLSRGELWCKSYFNPAVTHG